MNEIDWNCEGCGARVIAFGIAEAPRHQLCCVCAWACEYLDPTSPEWDVFTRRARSFGVLGVRSTE